MTHENIEQIRTAAYYIWEKEGCPEGKDEEIWYKACAQIQAAAKKPAQKAVTKKAATKVIVKPVNEAGVQKKTQAVGKIVAKPVEKKESKQVAKTVEKPAVKSGAKLAPEKQEKPAAKAKKTTEMSAKIKYNPIPVKTTSTKIITPLYGSIKK